MTQPIINNKNLETETEMIPLEQSAYFNGYTDEEKLKHYMEIVNDILQNKVKPLIPFFKAVVKYQDELYWAELQLNKNPLQYPDVEEYYWQSKFGLPSAHGFWFDLYELKRDYDEKPVLPYRPHTGRNKSGRMIQTTGNVFDKLKPSLNGSYRLSDFEVIQKIC